MTVSTSRILDLLAIAVNAMPTAASLDGPRQVFASMNDAERVAFDLFLVRMGDELAQGGYLDPSARKDPWGNDYRYVYPGTHGKEFDLFTYGADNQEGGEGQDADVGNWITEKQQ